jgi:hypothetical protein
MIQRLSGAILFSWVGTLIAAVMSWCVNPWFMDQPGPYLFVVLFPLLPLGWWLGPRLGTIRRPWLWALGSALVFVLSIVRPLPGPTDTRMLVIGVDGATWSVIERTNTPHIDALVAEGQAGTLVAEEPLFSPLLWSTLATGRTPDQHGIRGVRTRTDQSKVARFWEVARDAGLSVGLYKWLVTWPPPAEATPGFTVPAWLAGDARTHPDDLSWVKELELSQRTQRKQIVLQRPLPFLLWDGVFDGLRWSTMWAGIRFAFMERLSPLPPRKRDAFLRRLRLRIDRDVFVSRLHRHNPDVATFTMYVTDALSHTHWSSDDGRHVDGAYRISDTILGELVAEVAPDAHILLLSDHGFRNGGEGNGVHAVVPKIDLLKRILERQIGLVEIVRVGRQLVITPDVPVSVEAMRSTISALQYDDGTALFQVELFPRGVAWSLKVNHVPMATEWSGVVVSGHPLVELVSPGKAEEGEHDPQGIVVLKSPMVEPSALGNVAQVDVTPTILALLGLPVAENMQGKSWVSESVARVPSHDHLAPDPSGLEGVTNEPRLRTLGYVD